MKYELNDFEWNLVREALKHYGKNVPIKAQQCSELAEKLLKNAWDQAKLRQLEEEARKKDD